MSTVFSLFIQLETQKRGTDCSSVPFVVYR